MGINACYKGDKMYFVKSVMQEYIVQFYLMLHASAFTNFGQ